MTIDAGPATAGPQLVAPFPWFGGKRRRAADVWARFGDVANYVEPFAGSLAVLLGRPHAPGVETVNDRDAYLCNFWRATQADPEAVARWADWPVIETDLHARHRWLVVDGRPIVERLLADPDFYDAKVAGWWVWGLCQWIGSGWCLELDQRRPDLHGAGTGVHALPKPRPKLGREGGGGIHFKAPQIGRGRGRGVYSRHRIGGRGRGVHAQLPDLSAHHGRGLFAIARGESCAERRAALVALIVELRDRLRRVRICCGDWSRVLGPTPTYHVGLTGVFLDPPYSHDERSGHDSRALYAADRLGLADEVRAWAIANGDNPKMRIALCGYVGEHEMPGTWSLLRWKAPGGYGSQSNGRGRANAYREAIWFSPHCLNPAIRQGELFSAEAAG